MNWWIKTSQLNIIPLSCDSYGNLVLKINGKEYRYNLPHPYNSEDVYQKFTYYSSKGWGKRTKDLLDSIKSFLVKDIQTPPPEENKKSEQRNNKQLELPF